MLKDALSSIQRLYKNSPNVPCLLMAAIILAIDYVTGRAIRFPIIYILPVYLATWYEQKTTAYALAIIMPFVRVGFHFPWNQKDLVSVAVLNALINVLALVFYAYLVDRIVLQKRALEKKVKVLEGILPVCASCKRIRTPKGDFEQIEKYIMEHSEASFSHTICSECRKKLYPEYFKDE